MARHNPIILRHGLKLAQPTVNDAADGMRCGGCRLLLDSDIDCFKPTIQIATFDLKQCLNPLKCWIVGLYCPSGCDCGPGV